MKALKTLILFLTLSFFPTLSSAQLVHLELGGAGAIYSVNYDNRFSPKTKLGFRVGLGLLPFDGLFFVLPAQLNYVSGRDHGVEIGVGFTVLNSFGQLLNGRQFSGLDDSYLSSSITLAYRFKTKKEVNFRAGFTALPTLGFEFPWSVFMPTLSIGRKF